MVTASVSSRTYIIVEWWRTTASVSVRLSRTYIIVEWWRTTASVSVRLSGLI